MTSAPGSVGSGAEASVLVLGASMYQLPFIQAARTMGCRVITADNRPTNPGHSLADTSFECDTTNVDAIVSLALAERVDGVVAAATDVALEAASAVGERLNLWTPSTSCVSTLTRKLEFRHLQSRLGLPFPEFSATEPVPFPCIVKPNRASGSKGIRVVVDQSELCEALLQARAHSIDGLAFGERYLTGAQGTAEGVLHSGRVAAWMVTDRVTAEPPYVATVGHRTPASLPAFLMAELQSQIEQVFAALKYREGPFDCDFMVHEGRVLLIEVTPRAGGNSLVGLLDVAAGFDMPTYVIRMALGQRPDVQPFDLRPAAVRILGAGSAGRLSYEVEELDRLRSEPWVRHLMMDYPPGAAVQAFTEGRHRVGELVVVGSSRGDRDSRLAEALARLAIRTC